MDTEPSGAARGEPEPLGAALLPVVMHRLNNATQLLSALNAIVTGGGGEAFLAQRGDDLAQASSAAQELGWALAVLSSAAGHDLLLARRHARGLAIVVELVREGLQREGRELGPLEGALPELDPALGAGWELPWALGALLLSAGRAAATPQPVSIARRAGGGLAVTLEGVPRAPLEALAPVLAGRGVRLRIEASGLDALRAELTLGAC